MLVRTLLLLSVFGLTSCGKSDEPLTDVAPDETGKETGNPDYSTDSASEETPSPSTNNKTSCRPPPDPTDTSVYVKNKGMLCVVTSEVNWKIGKRILEGGPGAVDLRDCMAACLEGIDSGQTDSSGSTEYCQDSNGFTNNETCWAALAECEKDCGGPEITSSLSDTKADSTDQ